MEKQIKTNDYETGRRLNTSDSKDNSKSTARDYQKSMIMLNLLIIREIFNIIKPKGLSKTCLYAYLYGIQFTGIDLSKYRQIIDKITKELNYNDYIKLVTMTSASFKEYIESPVQNNETRFIEVIRKILNSSEIQEIYGNYDEFVNILFTRAQMSKAEASFNSLINRGEGDVSQIAQTLAEYGISKKYFNGNCFEADKDIIDAFSSYCADKSVELKDCVDILCEHIFSVKADNIENDDTVLIIDYIRDIINYISYGCDIKVNNESNSRIKDFTLKLAEKTKQDEQALLHFSQKQINDFYKNATNNFQRNSTSNITVPSLPNGGINEKK